MITEDYVSFETAKLLKEKGFDEKSFALYNPDGTLIQSGIRLNNTQVGRVKGSYSASTHQMAMKWLRKMHQIAIATNCWFGGERYISWHCTIMCYGEELKTQQDVELPYVATYEQACETAIKYCLENLI